jgi:hypothetical protein
VTTDEIRLLIDRLNGAGLRMATPSECVTALTTLLQDIEDLKHDNASMLDSLTKESVARCEAEDKLEIATQELKNIANADTVEWDDPTQYEDWAKSRARWALGKVEGEKPHG